MEQSSLPKNIRQIGQADQEPKVYIEDYVITFARRMEEKNSNVESLAVLLGKEPEKNGKEPVFIKGAVQVDKWSENQTMTFNNEIWSDIFEGVKNYFPELEIVGWLFLHSGQETGFDEKIKFIQETNFAGNGTILFVFDKEEKEENFYRFENSHFVKQSGYYIYYEKNEPMQNYMIDVFGNKSQEPAGNDRFVEQVREIISNKEPYTDKKNGNFIYAVGTALAAVVLVIGATSLSNYDKMQSMEQLLNNISANIEENKEEENDLIVETLNGTVGDTTSENASENAAGSSAEKPEDTMTENDNVESEENAEEDTEEPVEETMSEPNYYIVKKGDTLIGISGIVYGSDEYVPQIQEANQIDNKDMIYEGQKLIMP